MESYDTLKEKFKDSYLANIEEDYEKFLDEQDKDEQSPNLASMASWFAMRASLSVVRIFSEESQRGES